MIIATIGLQDENPHSRPKEGLDGRPTSGSEGNPARERPVVMAQWLPHV